MTTLTIVEHFNMLERSLDWYDNDTGELLRTYPEYVTAMHLEEIKDEMYRLRNIKIPTELHESRLWC